MEGSSKALAAPLPRMQQRQDLRFGAARRVDFVRTRQAPRCAGDARSSRAKRKRGSCITPRRVERRLRRPWDHDRVADLVALGLHDLRARPPRFQADARQDRQRPAGTTVVVLAERVGRFVAAQLVLRRELSAPAPFSESADRRRTPGSRRSPSTRSEWKLPGHRAGATGAGCPSVTHADRTVSCEVRKTRGPVPPGSTPG